MTDGSGRIYVDANVFIRAVEAPSDLSAPVQEMFELLRARPGLAATSELTLAEVLAKASTFHRRAYLSLMVWGRIFELLPVSREVLFETVDYRKVTGMPKLPDAIHAVSAIRAGCTTVVSGDMRLKMPAGYSVIRPDRTSIASLCSSLA